MTKKQKIAKRMVGFAPLMKRHLYWESGPPDDFEILRKLALHYRVSGWPLYEDYYPKPRSNDGLFQLLLELAGELYPAFKKPPSKGGRPRKYHSGLLVDYPDAHAARLAQLECHL